MAGSTPCFVSWRRSFRAMLATIWMCTQEWSLISSRLTAFTLATCHQPLSWSSALTRSRSAARLRFARGGTRMRICATACAGVSRTSSSACSETGSSIRSCISLSSSAMSRRLDRGRRRDFLEAAQLEVHERPGKGGERRRQRRADDLREEALPGVRQRNERDADADADSEHDHRGHEDDAEDGPAVPAHELGAPVERGEDAACLEHDQGDDEDPANEQPQEEREQQQAGDDQGEEADHDQEGSHHGG